MRKSAAALALASAIAALPSTGCSAAKPGARSVDPAFGDKVRAYLLAHPEVVTQALAEAQARQEQAEAAAARAQIAGARQAIERDPRDPVGGAPDGRITVTEFFDYRCPYCKASAPQLPAVLRRHPEVRFVYKEFPILSPESEQAARLALAAAKQGRFEPVHLALMGAARLDEPAMEAILAKSGVDVARAKADAASPTVTAQIADAKALALKIGVTGTPAFVVGDRMENGWSEATLEADLAAVKAGAAKPRG